MIRKFNRRKPRKNFNLDTVYHGILLDKATDEERFVFMKNKVGSPFFDDDLFCNMVLQKHKFLINKLEGNQTKRLLPFYPTYIPLVDSSIIITRDEYYWIANAIEYPCIRCHQPTTSIFGDFNMKNLLCGKCISTHYMTKAELFRQPQTDKEFQSTYAKNSYDFFLINKENQKLIFHKLIQREHCYNTKKINNRKDGKKTFRLNTIEKNILDLY